MVCLLFVFDNIDIVKIYKKIFFSLAYINKCTYIIQSCYIASKIRFLIKIYKYLLTYQYLINFNNNLYY